MPRMPRSASCRMFSHGKLPSMYLGARARNSLCASLRTLPTKARCSSERRNIIITLPCAGKSPGGRPGAVAILRDFAHATRMQGSAAELFHTWHDFYLLVGTASATLVGLMFVAASIGASVFSEQNR